MTRPITLILLGVECATKRPLSNILGQQPIRSRARGVVYLETVEKKMKEEQFGMDTHACVITMLTGSNHAFDTHR